MSVLRSHRRISRAVLALCAATGSRFVARFVSSSPQLLMRGAREEAGISDIPEHQALVPSLGCCFDAPSPNQQQASKQP